MVRADDCLVLLEQRVVAIGYTDERLTKHRAPIDVHESVQGAALHDGFYEAGERSK